MLVFTGAADDINGPSVDDGEGITGAGGGELATVSCGSKHTGSAAGRR